MDDLDKKLPRGHAYIRIRNKGYSVHLDFREKEIPWIEEVLKLAMKRCHEDDERDK